MKEQLKAAFTKFPHCLATYVCLCGMAWLLLFGWQPEKLDPPVFKTVNAEIVAQEAAIKSGGKIWKVSYTGSMKPLLNGGEYVVTVKSFDEIKKGEVLVYSATYNKNLIIHRAVLKDSGGWIMSGDSAKHTESWARVTPDNYVGTVVAIYKE